MSRRLLLAAAWAVAIALASSPVGAEDRIVLTTGTGRGTATEIARDIARSVAPGAEVALDIVNAPNAVQRLPRVGPGDRVELALTYADVLDALSERAGAGDPEADAVLRPLRVVLPLFPEEIHFLVRADSNLHYLHEIKDARVNVGPVGSAGAVTVERIYQTVFGAPIPAANLRNLANEEALIRLTTDRSVDVVAIVGGQPAAVIAGMKPEARRYVSLLGVDPADPSTAVLERSYLPATLRRQNYPSLLDADLPTIAVRMLLVASEGDAPIPALERFARSLCRNLPILRATGHPKWREVALAPSASRAGWALYEPAARELRACAGGGAPPDRAQEAAPPLAGATPDPARRSP